MNTTTTTDTDNDTVQTPETLSDARKAANEAKREKSHEKAREGALKAQAIACEMPAIYAGQEVSTNTLLEICSLSGFECLALGDLRLSRTLLRDILHSCRKLNSRAYVRQRRHLTK